MIDGGCKAKVEEAASRGQRTQEQGIQVQGSKDPWLRWGALSGHKGDGVIYGGGGESREFKCKERKNRESKSRGPRTPG